MLPATAENIRALLAATRDPIAPAAVAELTAAGNTAELDNRFFRTLAFGTGGLRGKTIGATLTAAEQGSGGPNDRPEHPCVGTNAMNFFNVSRATQGLVAYVCDWHARENRPGRPAICIAHDTRHFSREFAEFAAQLITDLGCDAHLFEGPRSTPELSFAVRRTGAAAGINLTASHNPPEYNGFKVYFADGGQIVEPHASAIIARVNAITSDAIDPLPADQRGQIHPLGTAIDAAYLDALETLILDPALLRDEPLSIVYSALHGVGGAIIEPLLKRLGVTFSTVASQAIADGRFPTVPSPNPENADALALAIAQAESEHADLVLATDPDADRMGAAARGPDGRLHLLTGNQLGSLMAWYRARKFLELGRLTPATAHHGVILKTFVTTDLQSAIAAAHGLRCVETLTGFKYIGAKLAKYEAAADGTVFVFGGEESYGYGGADFVRDKDANAAVAMICEVAASARSRGLTLLTLLDEIFAEFGYYLERTDSLTLDGAEGAAAIRRLVESLTANPPTRIAGYAVESLQDFAREDISDTEGDPIPKEAMLMLHLENGFRVAIRPSGTEPKIKFYLFGKILPPPGQPLNPTALDQAKTDLPFVLEQIWLALQADALQRIRE